MITSEFRSITSGIMFEYRTDLNKIMNGAGMPSTEEPSKFFIYSGNDGCQYLVEMENFKNTLFPGNLSDYYYPGEKGQNNLAYNQVNENYGDPVLGEEIGFNKYIRYSEKSSLTRTVFKKVGTILKPDNYENNILNAKELHNNILTLEEAKHGFRTANLYHDTIRIYFATGYILNNIVGINVKVSVPIHKALYFYDEDNITEAQYTNRYRNVNSKLYLLNWYLPKEMLKDTDIHGKSYINWIPSPLYMNSRFYDRYIEIKVPAGRSLCLKDTLYPDAATELEKYKEHIKQLGVDYVYSTEVSGGEILYYHGFPENNSLINIEVSTVSNDYIEFIDNDSTNYYESTFNVDAPREIVLSSISTSNFFNAQIYEDIKAGYIVYQPVWGDPRETNNLQSFNIDLMLQIESGVIPLVAPAEYDKLNDGMEDFIETYGDDVYKWIIINELSATYYYKYIIDPDTPGTEIQPYTEYYTNTIDYTGKTDENGEFWKSYFIPHIRQRANMTIDYIALKYTTHLYNRMNDRDIVKTASIIIANPMKYTQRTINTSNITNLKVVNKIVKNELGLRNGNTLTSAGPEVIEKNIRAYYSNQNIVVKQQGSDTVQNTTNIVLQLYRKSHNYRFNIYVIQQDNTRIPYDMSGLQEYKLSFPVLNTSGTGISSKDLEIFPVMTSIDTNLTMGQIMFYITEAQVKQIMSVPASERYFSFMTHNQNGQDESTIFEGTVQYLN